MPAFVVAYRGVLSAGWLGLSYEVELAVQGANVLRPAGGTTGLAVGTWASAERASPQSARCDAASHSSSSPAR